MTYLFIIVFIIAPFQIVFGQKQELNYHTEIDTIEIFEKRVFAALCDYEDDKLVEEFTAYITTVEDRVSRFRINLRIIMRTTYTSVIKRHGITKEFFEDGSFRISEYENGEEIKRTFFNQDGQEIPESAVVKTLKIGPCGVTGEEYIITGTKKKKKKQSSKGE